MSLPVKTTPPFRVKLDDSCCLSYLLFSCPLFGTHTNCPYLLLSCPLFGTHANCPGMLCFSLGGIDVILGVSWLETLRDVKVNWKQLTMQFVYNRTPVTLCSNSYLIHAPVSQHSLLKITEIDFSLLLWDCSMTKSPSSTVASSFSNSQSQWLTQLVEKFGMVFSDSLRVPPARKSDHQIPL